MREEGARQHPTATLAVLVVAGTSYALLQSLVAPALPVIQHDLHTSESGVSWVLTAYLLSASVATPLIGRLGDIFGEERLLVIALGLLAVGTLMAALADSLTLMLPARVVQGAAGGIFPLSFGIIRDEFPREKVAGTIGLLSALLGVGGGLGVALAGPITDSLSFHYLFWLPLIAIVLATIATHLFVPESPVKAPATINWLGAFLMALGLTAVLLAVTQAPSWGWGSARTLGLIGAGIAVLAAWVVDETRTKQPLVDMRMMRIRGVWTANAAALLLGFGMYASFFLLPQLVETPARAGFGFGASVTGAGLFMIPQTVGVLLAGTQAGRLEARFGSKPPLAAGGVVALSAYLMLALAHGARWEVYVASSLLGLGIGLAFAAMANLVIENVEPDETGVATGMNTVMRSVGGAFGGAVTASIISATVGRRLFPTDHGYTAAFLVCAGVVVLGIAAAVVAPSKRARRLAGQPLHDPA